VQDCICGTDMFLLQGQFCSNILLWMQHGFKVCGFWDAKAACPSSRNLNTLCEEVLTAS